MARLDGKTTDEQLLTYLGSPTPLYGDPYRHRQEQILKTGAVFTEIRLKLEAARAQGLGWDAAWRLLSASDRRHLADTEEAWRDAYLGRKAPPEIAALTRSGLF
jgi:hypothetical protein